MDIDLVFKEIGELGKQQQKYGAALCLLNVYAAFHMLQYAFVSFPVNYECQNDKEMVENQCLNNNRFNCKNLKFNVDTKSSIVSEWGLVCDQNWRSKATMSVFMMGVMIGALFLGNLADRVGRKLNMTLTTVGIILFNTVSALSPSYSLYIAAKFFVGFFCAGNILSIFVLGNELVGPSKRGVFGMTLQGSFAVGIVLFAFIASFVQHWRMLTGIISILGLPLLSYHWFIPESPRWLLAKNRLEESRKVLEEIAHGNGTVISSKLILSSPDQKTSSSLKKEKNEEGVLSLFLHSKLFLLTGIQLFSWFVNSASYYGLTLAASSAGGDLYTATALSGAVEIPAYILGNFLLVYLGRRWTLCGFMIGGGAACLAIQIFSESAPTLVTACALFGKLCLAASFAVVYVHSGEIFPTTIRNSAMGIMSVAARIGGILAPFIVLLGDTHPNLQFTVFGLLSVLAGAGNLKLPETLGRPLPEKIQDMLNAGKDGKVKLFAEKKTDSFEFEKEGLLVESI